MLSVYTACVNKFDRLSDYPKLYLGLEAVNTPRIQPYLRVDTCKRTGHLYTNQEAVFLGVRRSVSFSKRRLGCGCGASVASIIRRLPAPWLSSVGGRILRATNFGVPRAAPAAAAKVRPSSIQAGPAIILASVRFRRISVTKGDATARFSDTATACQNNRNIDGQPGS